MLAVVK